MTCNERTVRLQPILTFVSKKQNPKFFPSVYTVTNVNK